DISLRPYTIAIGLDQGKVYGDGDPILAYTHYEGVLATDQSLVGEAQRTPGESVGSYSINRGTLAIVNAESEDVTSNYHFVMHGASFTISPRPITLTADAGQGKVYGDLDPAYTYTAPALQFGDVFAGALSRETGENVGSYN